MRLIEDALDARWPVIILIRRAFTKDLGEHDQSYLGRW